MPQKIFGRNPEPDDLYEIVEKTLKRGELLFIDNDVDLTVSSGGHNGEDDPRKTTLHPKSGKALAALEAHGQLIGFLSNRAGGQVARMTERAKIKHATIVGTFGFELFHADLSHPYRGIAVIDDRFLLYSKKITLILRTLRKNLLQTLHRRTIAGSETEIEIPTPHGPIILERKGVCKSFPEGLAAGYNFNLVTPTVRVELIQQLQTDFASLAKSMTEKHYLEAVTLLSLWGINTDSNNPAEPGRFSIKFEPKIKEGKSYGLARQLHALEETMKYGQKIGLLIIAGDSNADGEAMKAGKMVEALSKKSRVISDDARSIGIWVKPDHDEPFAHKEADIVVNGPNGYAEVLEALADITTNKVS